MEAERGLALMEPLGANDLTITTADKTSCWKLRRKCAHGEQRVVWSDQCAID
jgi:hypothetical protein